MVKHIGKEHSYFKSHPRQMRILLFTNFIYALGLPIIELFIGAYIIRNSFDFGLVMIFQLAQSFGIPITFLLNGILLKRFPIARLYSLGMLLSCVSMTFMMFLPVLTVKGISIAGLIMGISYGFFWANRSFLALTSTQNENRNYYYGLETVFYTAAFIISPLMAGHFIFLSQQSGWFGGKINIAYYILTAVVFLLTIIASVLAHSGEFKNPGKSRFLFFNFHKLWRKMLQLAVLKGIAQGYITTAPVMLIMKLVGDEGTVGAVQSLGASITAIFLYLLGRMTKEEHRLKILTAGLTLFLIGSMVNAALYSSVGVIIFIACLVLSRPLMDLAYFPIQLSVIEIVSRRERRNQFAYILSHEIGLFSGRLFGCGLFLILTYMFSEDIALQFALPAVGIIQMISVPVARFILSDKSCQDLSTNHRHAVEVLKEPIEL
jgi:MFS transporter, YQGE family, putative transporter